jgi:hypothetical protein
MEAELEESRPKAAGQTSRRRFIHALGMLSAGAVATSEASSASPRQTSSAQGMATTPGEVPRRRLGRANVEVSAPGVGGHHLGDFENKDEALRLFRDSTKKYDADVGREQHGYPSQHELPV